MARYLSAAAAGGRVNAVVRPSSLSNSKIEFEGKKEILGIKLEE